MFYFSETVFAVAINDPEAVFTEALNINDPDAVFAVTMMAIIVILLYL
jgi:hypothetical protein